MKGLSGKVGKVVHDDPLCHPLQLAVNLKTSLKNKLLNILIWPEFNIHIVPTDNV